MSHSSLDGVVGVCTRPELYRVYFLWASGQVWPGVCLWVSAPGVHSSGSTCQTGVYVLEAGHVFVGVLGP